MRCRPSARTPLRASYLLTSNARVTVTLVRGKRTVRRVRTRTRKAGRAYPVRVSVRALRRGTYKLRVVARQGKSRATSTVTVRRL